MKICMVSQHPPFDVRSYYKIRKTFIKCGHEVWYINWVKRANEYNWVKPTNKNGENKVIKIFSEISPPQHPLLLRGLQSLRAFELIYKQIKKISPDILYINSPFLLPLALYCKKKLNKLSIIYDIYEDFYGINDRFIIVSHSNFIITINFEIRVCFNIINK